MVPLDKKYVEILSLLIEERTPVSASWVAEKLKLTPRVAQYRVHRISGWLKANGYILTCKPGYGILFQADDRERDRLREMVQCIHQVNYFSLNDRIHLILLFLLVQNQPLTIKEMQYELGVSRMTVIKDLDRVKLWLRRFKLDLVKRQNFGCTLVGEESDFRWAIVSLILETIGEIELLTSFGNLRLNTFLEFPERSIVIQRMATFLKTLRLDLFNSVIDQIQDLAHLSFADHAHMQLALQTGIQSYRIKQGKIIPPVDPEDVKFYNKDLYIHIKPVVERIQREMCMTFPYQEVDFLIKQITRTEPGIRGVNSAVIAPVEDEKVNRILEAILDTATLYLHPAIKLDQALRENLATHLSNDFNSVSSNIKTNPFLSEIKENYPEIFKITRTCLETVSQKIAWIASEDEVGFITMYLAASLEQMRGSPFSRKKVVIVCNSGVATSGLLAARVRTEFPEIEIQGVMSYLEYKNYPNQNDYDLIISTIPISTWEKPAIIVGPFLENGDIQRIRSYVQGGYSNSIKAEEGAIDLNHPSLSSFLNDKTLDLQVEATGWQEVIRRAGQLLVKTNSIETRYIDAMIRVREEYGPYMVVMPGVAILHAFSEDGVRKTGMSLVTIHTPVSFGHPEFDPVAIAIVLAAADHQTHLRGLAELVDLLHDERAMKILRRSNHKSQVLSLIASFASRPAK